MYMWSDASILFASLSAAAATAGTMVIRRRRAVARVSLLTDSSTTASALAPALDGIADAVLAVDAAGLITYVNPAAVSLTGVNINDLIGQPINQRLQISDSSGATSALATLIAANAATVAVEVTRSRLQSAGATAAGEIYICRTIAAQCNVDQMAHDERDILESIAANRTLDDVVERLAAWVGKLRTGLRLAVVIRREGMSHCFGGVPPETRRAIEKIDTLGTPPASWWTVPRVFDDVQQDPIFTHSAAGFRIAGIRSCWAFPVIASTGGDTQAVLLLFPGTQSQPEVADLTLADRCGKLIHLAVDRERMTERLAAQSLHDPLTGLPNRMLTSDRLGHALKRARRTNSQLATLLIDLDGFKAINDSLGNQHGDQLLQQVADRLKLAIRSSDTLGRLGNDQFMLVASDISEQAIAIICERLLSAFKQPFDAAGKQLTLTTSIGISCYPSDGDDVNALLRNADTALVHAKRQNRGGYRLFESSMNEATLERVELENQLRTAIQNNELVVFYQPQVDVTGHVSGVEALIRWKRNGVLIAPMKFIPIAEECGLIVPVGTWVLREACRWCKSWQIAGRKSLRVAVNVSALQFAQDDFVQVVRDSLGDADLDPSWLEVEVTESLLMQNTKNVAAKLERLREMGVAVAIDDFGTGYSSLAYLQKLPIDILKIDRSFVKDIPSADDHSDKTAVIRAILSMAHSLQLKVVAEGVETETHLQFLRRAGCHQMQGYFFSPPKPGDELAAIVDRLDRNAVFTKAA